VNRKNLFPSFVSLVPFVVNIFFSVQTNPAMDLKQWYKPTPRLDQRMRQIAELGRLRDRLLESPVLDMPALEQLAADYEAAGLPSSAASLRRRLEWYRGRKSQR
jgi:hypothetical protein